MGWHHCNKKQQLFSLPFIMCVTLDLNRVEINQKLGLNTETCLTLIYPRQSDNVLYQLQNMTGDSVSRHLSNNLIIICISECFYSITLFASSVQTDVFPCVCVAAECCHGEGISLRDTRRWHQCLMMLSPVTSLENGCCYLFVNLNCFCG